MGGKGKSRALGPKLWEAFKASLLPTSDGPRGDICCRCWCRRGDHLPDWRGKLVLCPEPPLPLEDRMRYVLTYIDDGEPSFRVPRKHNRCRGTRKDGRDCRRRRGQYSLYCHWHRPPHEWDG